MSALGTAFKEWAVICRALATGRQALILRKGGIAEPGGTFHVEHRRFWLYPTWVHQQAEGVLASARPLLDEAVADRPPEGTVRLSHFAEVAEVHFLADFTVAEKLADLHCWSADTVRSRFAYRRPGLFALGVRVWKAEVAHELAESSAYAGCKSWVELGRELSTEGASPVLSDAAFAQAGRALRERLGVSG